VRTLQSLIQSSIAAGFFNIDIDTSTLVDLSQETIPAQQRINYTLCAELSAFVRTHEPEAVTISIGGEIGEVGGHNSTEPELRAFMEGFNRALHELAPGATGLSKISIQSGTSHGGVVLPDGSIAQVSVDFDTLQHLSHVARADFGMAGAVQHGASTLPVSAFSRFAEAGTCEVHLATGFQNILFEHLPEPLTAEIYAYLDKNHADERKADQTDEQFRYKARKRALGPFKRSLWELPASNLSQIESAWEDEFRLLFDRLNIHGTRSEVERHVKPASVAPDLATYAADADEAEDVSDLAD
jgi:fructose/tagatose bisphosphate aldolase